MKVKITETYTYSIDIDADTEEDAIEKARDLSPLVDLDPDEIDALKNSESSLRLESKYEA